MCLQPWLPSQTQVLVDTPCSLPIELVTRSPPAQSCLCLRGGSDPGTAHLTFLCPECCSSLWAFPGCNQPPEFKVPPLYPPEFKVPPLSHYCSQASSPGGCLV